MLLNLRKLLVNYFKNLKAITKVNTSTFLTMRFCSNSFCSLKKKLHLYVCIDITVRLRKQSYKHFKISSFNQQIPTQQIALELIFLLKYHAFSIYMLIYLTDIVQVSMVISSNQLDVQFAKNLLQTSWLISIQFRLTEYIALLAIEQKTPALFFCYQNFLGYMLFIIFLLSYIAFEEIVVLKKNVWHKIDNSRYVFNIQMYVYLCKLFSCLKYM